MRAGSLRRGAFAAALLVALVTSGCSVRKLAINSLADALAGSGDVYASDDDPELVGSALPFALKTIESLLVEAPEHRGLLLSACSGFTQFAYAFVAARAEAIELDDYFEAERQRERALKLYLRARDYCLRSLELDHPGITGRLQREPRAAAAELDDNRIELIYWTGASWGAAVAAGVHRLEIVADLPAVEALMRRALEIDERWGDGAIHEAMISLAALPKAMGGSPERARAHFERAVELADGASVSPFVALAASVSVAQQNRAEFRDLLQRALDVELERDPSRRLANVVAQRRARLLLERADELFLEPLEDPIPEVAAPVPDVEG
jgi:predicted anti-sigma-YlaC factor YlaD